MTTAGRAGPSGSAVTLRPATEADYEFMRRLYVSTREAEMADTALRRVYDRHER